MDKAKNIEEYLTIYINNLLDLNNIKFHLKIETIAEPNYDVVPEFDEETDKELQAAYEEHRAIKGKIGSGIIIVFFFSLIALGSVISIGIFGLFFPRTKKKMNSHLNKKSIWFFS